MLAFAVAITCALLPITDAAANPELGSPAPPFEGETLDGEIITLEQLAGNVVVVNLWATWCAPCREELPLLEGYLRAREEYGLRVVAVTMDAHEVPNRVMQRVQDELEIPLFEEFDGDYEKIGGAVPTNYVIDRAGIIRYAEAGALTLDALNEILVPLLNEPLPQPEAILNTAENESAGSENVAAESEN